MRQTHRLSKLANAFPALVFLALQACNVAYIPPMHNVPLLQKQGELVVSATGANFQAAYGVINHLGLMVNGQVKDNSWTETNLGYRVQRNYYEGALGFFNSGADKKTVEIYGGGGFGSLDFQNDWTFGNMQRYRANMYKTFIQPNIGVFNEYVDIAFSLRVSMVRFSNVNIENYSSDDLKNLNLDVLDKQPYFFVEPGLTFRGGYKWIKLQLQYVHATKMNTEDINYSNNLFFLGVSVRF